MPMELQIIRAHEFIRLGPRGHFDLKASRAVLAVLAGACLKRGIHQALLDLRALHPGPKPVFSPSDLVTLVNTFRQIGFTHRQRLAVLYRSDPHHRASMFASIARLRGWSVKAFDDFEDAVTWLSRAEQEPSEVETESTTKAKKVPVRQLKDLEAASKAIAASQPTIHIKSNPGPKPDATQPRIRKDQGASARVTPASPRFGASGLTRAARTQHRRVRLKI